jgi:NitT/TauT family transport system ATP-binding protein
VTVTDSRGASPTRMASDMAVIETERVSVARGDLQIIERIDLSVDNGELVCILGSSGCGKSTFLRVLGGLLPPTGGTIKIAGEPPERGWTNLAYVFQSPHLLPWRSVGRNVELGLELRYGRKGMRREAQWTDEKTLELLDLVGLADRVSSRASVLSGGERQRVALCRALALRPRALLMDEPFAALDVFTRERLRDSLLHIQAQTGVAIIFVTHDIDEAVYLGDRVIVLDRKPSRVVLDQVIDLPRPRLATSKEFIERAAGIRSVFSSTSAQEGEKQ